MQPGLCPHTVIALTFGPALTVAFEGSIDSDQRRQHQVLQYIATGLVGNVRITCKKVRRTCPVENKVVDEGKNVFFEHLECLQYDREPEEKQSHEGIKISKRKQPMLFLCLVKNKYVKKTSKRR